MTELGRGLHNSKQYEDALSVQEAELATERRLGAHEQCLLIVQGNLAITLERLGRFESALEIKRDVYMRHLKLNGKENYDTIRESSNYADSLVILKRFKEARALLRKTMPVARRVLGESKYLTLRLRWNYARALFLDDSATLDDLREAVMALEDSERIARRVFGGTHPLTEDIERSLRLARAAKEASSLGDAMAAMTPRDAQDPSS